MKLTTKLSALRKCLTGTICAMEFINEQVVEVPPDSFRRWRKRKLKASRATVLAHMRDRRLASKLERSILKDFERMELMKEDYKAGCEGYAKQMEWRGK